MRLGFPRPSEHCSLIVGGPASGSPGEEGPEEGFRQTCAGTRAPCESASGTCVSLGAGGLGLVHPSRRSVESHKITLNPTT